MNGVLTPPPVRRYKNSRSCRRTSLQPQPLPEWAQFVAVLLIILQLCGQVNAVETINPLGNKWDYAYDARNRKVQEIEPSVADDGGKGDRHL